jgi:hypothetical protein
MVVTRDHFHRHRSLRLSIECSLSDRTRHIRILGAKQV